MGCEPSRLPGYQKIEVARAVHEAVWGQAIPANIGFPIPPWIPDD